MATQIEIFRTVAPEFLLTSDLDVQAYLDLALLFIDQLKFSAESRGLAIALMAASLLYTRQRSISGTSSGQNLTMEKEGDLSRQYGNGTVSKTGVLADIYMQRLNELALPFSGATIMTRFGGAIG